DAVAAHEGPSSFAYKSTSMMRHASVSTTNGGRWRVIAHVSEEDATRLYVIARWALIAGIVVTVALIVASLFFVADSSNAELPDRHTNWRSRPRRLRPAISRSRSVRSATTTRSGASRAPSRQ